MKPNTDNNSEPVIKSDEVKGRMQRLVRPSWLSELTEEVREASKAFKNEWPDAWLYLGYSESNDAEKDWYDWSEDLLGLPVFHCPAWLKHSGYDGEHQKILPVWKGDVSNKSGIIREFECRLAKSGDF
tara:strand:- start:292 stop:675 length:384 start_codon:yes stop_codon:yes gene_type:complete